MNYKKAKYILAISDFIPLAKEIHHKNIKVMENILAIEDIIDTKEGISKKEELISEYEKDVSSLIFDNKNLFPFLIDYLENIHQIYGSRLERNLWAFGGWFCGSFAAFLLVRYVFH